MNLKTFEKGFKTDYSNMGGDTIHICTENPCTVQDKQIKDRLSFDDSIQYVRGGRL